MTASTLHPRTCRACGCSFPGGPRAWYCPHCRMERKAEASRKCKARARSGEVRPLGSADACRRCGEAYTVKGGRQRYCPACAAPAVAEVDRKQGLAYYSTNRERINLTRNGTRRVGKRMCEECGKAYWRTGRAKTCGPACARLRRNRLARARLQDKPSK